MARPINLEVISRKGESAERLVKRFSKKMKKSGIMEEILNRRFYEKPSKIKRRKSIDRSRTIKRAQEKERGKKQ